MNREQLKQIIKEELRKYMEEGVSLAKQPQQPQQPQGLTVNSAPRGSGISLKTGRPSSENPPMSKGGRVTAKEPETR